jgi:FtsZ-interacting cell division protein ZipA
MDINMISLIVATVALLIALGTFYFWNSEKKKSQTKTDDSSFSARPLQLQAYERLVMLAERIALPNLVSRVNQSGMNAKEMQLLLLESIKQEYEYNATQQIYVSPVAWEAIKNLKDQNMLIINQVAAAMPPEGTGTELNRRLIDFVMTQKRGALHTIVLEALNYEAKKLLK